MINTRFLHFAKRSVLLVYLRKRRLGKGGSKKVRREVVRIDFKIEVEIDYKVEIEVETRVKVVEFWEVEI